MNKQGVSILTGIIIALVVLGVSGIVYYNYNENQKTITANTIKDLEQKLEEQGELTKEQERQLEELAQVTCKEVQVPYDALEEYTEQEPYAEDVCEDINIIYKKDNGACIQYKDNFFADDEPARYDCTITNLDNQAGTFYMEIGFYISGQKITEVQNKYVYPQSSQTFSIQKMAQIDSCYCVITSIPTKQECETITNYRTIVKTRTITKYRTETLCE